jgi:putative PEP-CTERM system TPR-repeat lipoprotein
MLAAVPAVIAATEGPPPAAPAKANDANDLRREEIELRNAVRANPGDPENHVKLGRLYIEIGNFPAVEAEAREAVKDGGGVDETAPLLAEAMLNQGKLSQLLDEIKPADRDPSAEAEVRLNLGLAHLGLREESDAEPLLKDAVRLDPESWRAKLGLARFLMIQGDVSGADQQVKAARAIAPDNVEVLRMSAEILRTQGDIAGAIKEFGTILAAHPNDVPALLGRANALIAQNKLDEAHRDVAVALKLAPKAVAGIYLDALVLARQGKLKVADDRLETISGAFDSLPNAYYLAGAIKYALGQLEQSDDDLAKFMAREPKLAAPRRLRAMIALRRNDPQSAIDFLKPAVAAAPSDRVSASLLARAYVAAGRSDDAVQLYENAAAAEPGNVQVETRAALMRMSYGNATEGLTELEKVADTGQGADLAGPLVVLAELREGDTAKAAQSAQALLRRSPNDPVIRNLVGSTQIAALQLPQAEATFAGLVKSNPQFAAAHYNLARVLIAEHKPDDAKRVLTDFLAAKPGDERTLLQLAGLAGQQQDFAEAADRLTAAQKVAPKDPEPGIELVELYAQQKNWSAADGAMQTLQASFPDNGRITDLAVDLRLGQGDAAGAVKLYQPLTQRFANSPPVMARYAALEGRAGDKDGERAALAKAVTLAPQNGQYMAALVGFDYANKGADAALATARSFVPAAPEISELLAADVLVRGGHADQAVKELTAFQQQHSSDAIEVKLAQIVYGEGKHDAAKAALKALIKDHANDLDARRTLADMLLSEGDNDGAQALYEEVRAKSPQDLVAMNNLAVIYARKKDPRAVELAAAAYRLAPRPETADTLGWALVSTGKAGDGLPYLRRASAALPQNASITYHLAAALGATGQKDEARTILEKLLQSGGAFDDKADAQHLLATLGRG